MNIDKYLYEIIEDFKNAKSEEEQLEIFRDFCSSIWSSTNKRRVYTKTIKFKVRNDLLNSEVGQIFNINSEIDYMGYKAMTKDTDWCSLLRQKINNIYTRYFDEQVILNKDYMDLLRTSKRLYCRWVKGEEMTSDELVAIIDESMYEADRLKVMYQKQKMELSWTEYKKIIEKFLFRAFNNSKLIDDYENEHLTGNFLYDFYNEDNFYIKYFCKSLEGEMRKWQKKKYKVRDHKKYKRCKECGSLIEKTNNRAMYCKSCYKKINESDAASRMKRHREKKKQERYFLENSTIQP